ncbi:hypothetical protein V144x_21640 [Gimesia aquarii]|uniref:Lipoprotein n=2 Tax=Gimesia aquarii TaxID=2527964 RepID=A0A517VUM9_9PLAN|nr:hypothetical protein V144x_21640 [Gimesia aquarii]
MKQTLMLLLLLLLSQQGCTSGALQLGLLKNYEDSKKHTPPRAEKIAKRQHKVKKEFGALNQQITLVDFKLFSKEKHEPKKHHKHKGEDTATGNVAASFFPMGPQLIEVPRQGVGLYSFLIEYELDYAILTTKANIRNKFQALANAKAETAKAMAAANTAAEKENAAQKKRDEENVENNAKKAADISSILELRPKVIYLIRGPVTTVFPRVFLGAPQVANISILPNDLIFTQTADDFKEFSAKNKTKTSSTRKNGQIILRGIAKRTGVFEIGTNGNEVNPSSVILTEDYSKEFDKNVPAVIVIYRNFEGRLLRILLPNYYYGIFSRPQSAKQNISADEKEAIETAQKKWNVYYEPFTKIILQDGDVIEFTTLDLLDLSP